MKRQWIVRGCGLALMAMGAVGCSKSSPSATIEEAEAPALSELSVKRVSVDLKVADPEAAFWREVPRGSVTLMAQPMIAPKPETTTTEQVIVQAAHDGRSIAIRLSWKDPDKSEGGHLGEQSDAFALQFPVKDGANAPAMMGAKDMPVHIYHWRAQYQRDAESGKPEMKDLYPNMVSDMYPMEFRHTDAGTEEGREQFSPARALGNPQAYPKTGVDEIVAEGFATSAVQDAKGGAARGVWSNGRWDLVITRPLAVEDRSKLEVGGEGHIAFAAWQGGAGEVGSRKSVTMAWLPMRLQP